MTDQNKDLSLLFMKQDPAFTRVGFETTFVTKDVSKIFLGTHVDQYPGEGFREDGKYCT